MENKKIVYLHELRFTDHDIEKIGMDTYAFIATFAFAVDEISVFSKLLIQSVGNRPKDNAMLQLYAIQHNAITRVLSAKVFETIKLFESYIRHLKEENRTSILQALEHSCDELQTLKRLPAFKLSARLRNKITNHYEFNDCRLNLKDGASSNVSRSMFLHKEQGNSFSPFAEELVFLSRIKRYVEDETRAKFGIKRLKEWTEWNANAAKWSNQTFNSYIFWLLENVLLDKVLDRKMHYLEPELFGKLQDTNIPIVFDPHGLEL